MNEERIDIADPEISRRHALPTRAAVTANAKTGRCFRAAIGRRRGAVEFIRIVGWNEHAMRVGIDIVVRRPRLATVRALEKAADFHGDMNDVGIFRMKGNALRMRLVRRRWKSPFLDSWHLTQTGQLGPVFAEIIAII